MFWKKKKPKSKQKSQPKKPIPKHIADNLEAGKKTIEGFEDGLAQKTKTSERKKPEVKKSEKTIDYRKEFLKVFRQLTYRYQRWDIWSDFVTLFACSLSNPMDKTHFDERENEYMQIIKRYNKEEQSLFHDLAIHTVMAMEENPEQDFLGGIFMELNLGNEHNGQFFTPYHVCQLMAEISMDDIVQKVNDDGYIAINDPCCGAGATLIAAAHVAKKRLEKAKLNYQNHVLFVAQDIDRVVALMCYIQLSLLGVAAYIKIGNTFTEPMAANDSKENYWYTPIYFSQVWTMRRLFRSL